MPNFQEFFMTEKSTNLKRVRYIATQLYMLFLKEKSGGLSYRKMEMIFKKAIYQSNEEFKENCSGAFSKYARGATCIKDQQLIDRIEKVEQYQGGKYILNHPLWLMLENPNATLEVVRDLMHKLPPNIQARLFKLNKSTNQYERNFWTTSAQFSRVSMNNNLDALACFLMLMREMELLKKWHAYTRAKWYAHDLFIRLSYFKPISEICANLYSLIYAHFIARHNPITVNNFSTEDHDIYTYLHDLFKSPFLIEDFAPYHFLLNDTIAHAKEVMNIGDTKEEQLNFLFWVSELNLMDVNHALKKYDKKTKKPFLIHRLITACSDSNTRRHIRKSEIFNF